jgi:hypothetical protein
MAASALIKDLSHVPNIVGSLGLSIAAAQRALDANYLDGVERILALTRMMLAPVKSDNTPLTDAENKALDDARQMVKDMLTLLAPSRYQFTETTLTVKLDLAQSLDVNVGLGIGLPAVGLNATLSAAFGMDYRAAAECKTVIHAIPMQATVMNKMLDRAAAINDRALTLPDVPEVDAKLFEQGGRILDKLTGVGEVKKPAKANGQ